MRIYLHNLMCPECGHPYDGVKNSQRCQSCAKKRSLQKANESFLKLNIVRYCIMCGDPIPYKKLETMSSYKDKVICTKPSCRSQRAQKSHWGQTMKI